MSKVKIKAGLAALILGAGFSGAGSAWAQADAANSAVAELALYQGADRQQRLIEGAKKEGELSLYHSMPKDDMQPVIDAFTKKYGIKVKTWRSSSSGIVQKITTEARGGRFDVDIMEDNAPGNEAVRREQLLQKVISPSQQNVMPQAVPAHGEWVGSTIDVLVQSYNTNQVKQEELPKSYQDLLDPKWKGRLGVEAEDQDWFAVLVQALGQEKGEKLFRDIADTNGISVRRGHSLLTSLVASGEVPLALTTYNYKPAQMKRDGAPIDSFVIPPAIGYFRGTAMFKKAPHPHAALLFYDFMLSDEAQKILASNFNIATSKNVDSPEKKRLLSDNLAAGAAGKAPAFIFIDPAHSLDMFDAWIKSYEQNVVKRAKQ